MIHVLFGQETGNCMSAGSLIVLTVPSAEEVHGPKMSKANSAGGPEWIAAF